MNKFGQNLNCDKMMYLIKYTLTVQFSIQDYTRQLHNNNLYNFFNKKNRNWTKKSVNDKTPYV